jgi:hypothetical protein
MLAFWAVGVLGWVVGYLTGWGVRGRARAASRADVWAAAWRRARERAVAWQVTAQATGKVRDRLVREVERLQGEARGSRIILDTALECYREARDENVQLKAAAAAEGMALIEQARGLAAEQRPAATSGPAPAPRVEGGRRGGKRRARRGPGPGEA